jgi:hypothetical protein
MGLLVYHGPGQHCQQTQHNPIQSSKYHYILSIGLLIEIQLTGWGSKFRAVTLRI